MRVLVADKFEESGLKGLSAVGCEVVYEPALVDNELLARLSTIEPRVLIVRSTRVTAEMLDSAGLGLVVRAGAGYNTIDVEAAAERGILVSNTPGKNSIAVAELAFGLILSLDRRIPDNVIDLRNGKWNKAEYSKGSGIHGKTLGLIGMGNIAQEMVTRAKAFGMSVIAYSRWMTAEVAAALGIGRATTLPELAALADVISVHVALSPATRSMLSTEFFESMKPGAMFINTSRAEVVDQAALLSALTNNRIVAGLDVFEDEPSGGRGDYSGPFRDIPNVYCTHHIGASTTQAQEAVAAEVVRIVREYKTSGQAINAVNVPSGGHHKCLLIVRHADRVGVLAHVFTLLREGGLNVQEMENVVLRGAAIAQIALDEEPSKEILLAMKSYPDIYDAHVMPLD